MKDIILIMLITILGPIIGSIIGIIKKPSKKFMFNLLAFAAGIMITISFYNLIPESINKSNVWICIIGLIIGSVLMYLVDLLIPHVHTENIDAQNNTDMKKTSIYLTTGLFIHNIPEGLVIAIATISETKIGIAIAVSIAIQKIPEGICTCAPHYYCNNNRCKSFLISLSTLIPLLIGFAIGYFLYANLPLFLVGIIIGIAAGMMIYISVDELIPSSSSKLTNQFTIISLILGIIFVILLNNI